MIEELESSIVVVGNFENVYSYDISLESFGRQK